MRTLKNLLQHCLSKKVASTYSAECQFNLCEYFRMTALILPLREKGKDIHHAAITLSLTECEPSSTFATTPHQRHHRLIEEQCLNIGFGDSDYYSMIPYSTLIEKQLDHHKFLFPIHCTQEWYLQELLLISYFEAGIICRQWRKSHTQCHIQCHTEEHTQFLEM